MICPVIDGVGEEPRSLGSVSSVLFKRMGRTERAGFQAKGDGERRNEKRNGSEERKKQGRGVPLKKGESSPCQ